MTDIRDFGVAVSDAIRINDCYHQLTEFLSARPSFAADKEMWLTRAAASPGHEEWVHRVNSRNVAEQLLRQKIMFGGLTVWIRLENSEAPVDSYAIKDLGHRSLAAGAYIPINESQLYLYGRPLWIKRADWAAAFDAIKLQRGDADFVIESSPDDAETSLKPQKSKIDLPPLPQAKLLRWWENRSAPLKTQTEKQILEAARSAFPNNHISRQRIRDLIGPRKRGPKPIRG